MITRTHLLIALLVGTIPIHFQCAAPRGGRSDSGRGDPRIPALRAQYGADLEALLPALGAEEVAVRADAQQTLEKMCHAASRRQAGWPGRRGARACGLCLAMGDRLGPETPRPARVWMIRQIERIGGAESVPILARLLTDDDPLIREPARRALQLNPDPAARDALLHALRGASSDPDVRVALINALGARSDVTSEQILPFARVDQQPTAVVAAAVSALGGCSDATALDTLYALWRADEHSNRDLAAAALLRTGDRLLTEERRDDAARLFTDIYLSSSAPPNRAAALRGLAMARGADALPRFMDIICGDVDADMRPLAAQLTQYMEGEAVAREIALRLVGASTDAQVLILDVLGVRGDAAVKPAVLDAYRRGAAPVRVAAMRALGELGDVTDAAWIANVAAGATGEERTAARACLDHLRGLPVDRKMVAMLGAEGDSAVRAEVARSLGERGYAPAVPTLFVVAETGEDVVRAAAFKAIAKLAGEADASSVARLLVYEQSDEPMAAAEDALVSLCRGIEDESARATPVLARLAATTGQGRAPLVRVLGRIGGPDALDAVRAALADEGEVGGAAVRALANWSDIEALPDLYELASANTVEEHRVLALRGYVRLVRLASSRTPLDTLAMLETAMALADRAEERKQVLAGVGQVIERSALDLARRFLTDPEVADEAAAAALAIARPLSAVDPLNAAATVDDLLAADVAERVHDMAREAREYIDAHSGFITTWMIAGPYAPDDVESGDLIDTAFTPETAVDEVAWRVLAITDPADPWTFDLADAVGGDNRCIYVRSHVVSDSAGPALMQIGSDDGVKVWLNGTVVHDNNVFRGHTRAEDEVPVTLNEGDNTLMLKVVQGGGGWAFSCGLRAVGGGKLDGVSFRAE